eukprot:6402053-Amphidinium_carterae.1
MGTTFAAHKNNSNGTVPDCVSHQNFRSPAAWRSQKKQPGEVPHVFYGARYTNNCFIKATTDTQQALHATTSTLARLVFGWSPGVASHTQDEAKTVNLLTTATATIQTGHPLNFSTLHRHKRALSIRNA